MMDSKFTINGRQWPFARGESILRAGTQGKGTDKTLGHRDRAQSHALGPALSVAVPARELPGVVVPTGQLADELVPDAGNAGAGDNRNHDVVVHRELVALDQQSR